MNTRLFYGRENAFDPIATPLPRITGGFRLKDHEAPQN
jgi:hypothetical protein